MVSAVTDRKSYHSKTSCGKPAEPRPAGRDSAEDEKRAPGEHRAVGRSRRRQAPARKSAESVRKRCASSIRASSSGRLRPLSRGVIGGQNAPMKIRDLQPSTASKARAAALAGLARRGEAGCRGPAGDQVGRRDLPARDRRGQGLQPRNPRPEGVQRRSRFLSRFPLEDVSRGLPRDDDDAQARWIEATVTGEKASVRVCGLYLPNGKPRAGAEVRLQARVGGPAAPRPPGLGWRGRGPGVLRRLCNLIPSPTAAGLPGGRLRAAPRSPGPPGRAGC